MIHHLYATFGQSFICSYLCCISWNVNADGPISSPSLTRSHYSNEESQLRDGSVALPLNPVSLRYLNEKLQEFKQIGSFLLSSVTTGVSQWKTSLADIDLTVSGQRITVISQTEKGRKYKETMSRLSLFIEELQLLKVHPTCGTCFDNCPFASLLWLINEQLEPSIQNKIEDKIPINLARFKSLLYLEVWSPLLEIFENISLNMIKKLALT